MKQVLFFALKEDLLPMLELVESKGILCYARMGNFQSREVADGISIFENGAALPHLGTANANSTSACDSFLACERGTSINLRHFRGLDSERACVDQLANPDSVEFTPGGLWNEDVVIQGRVATASESEVSQALIKRFQAAIKKTFSKVKAFYVGPAALALLESGKRLTSSEQSPCEYDLIPVGRTKP
jgi:hypothetical protein